MRSGAYQQPVLILVVILAMIAVGIISLGGGNGDAAFRLETFRTSDGGLIEGALYSRHHDRVVLLCHGQAFDKESWSDLALAFQKAKIDSFAIDFRGYGNSSAPTAGALERDVLAAVHRLAEKGYERIGILGGSMGGRAVLEALAQETPPNVDRVAILAANGPAIGPEEIEKLFIVSRRDAVYSGVLETFAKSSDPKDLKVFLGSAHAQHLFRGRHRDELIRLLITFFEN